MRRCSGRICRRLIFTGSSCKCSCLFLEIEEINTVPVGKKFTKVQRHKDSVDALEVFLGKIEIITVGSDEVNVNSFPSMFKSVKLSIIYQPDFLKEDLKVTFS